MAKDIYIKMLLDSSNYTKEGGKVRIYARDTKKELDAKTKFKMEIDIIQAQNNLKKIKQDLKDPNLSGNKKIRLQIEANDVQRTLTEAKRGLNNYLNTGDIATSRLQNKFTGLGNVIKNVIGGNISSMSGFSPGLGGIATKFPLIGAGIAIFAGLSQAIKNASQTAIEFEDAFVSISKTVDGTPEQLDAINSGVVELSKTIPLSVSALGQIAALGGQLGIPTQDILEFTKIIAELGVTTNLTEQEAATAFAKIRNITQEPLENLSRMGSTVVALGNNFATTEKDITEFSQRIAGAGEIAGLTTSEVFAISTAFSSVGVEAEAGGTSVQKVLLDINNAVKKGGKELKAFSVVAGKTPKEFAKLRKEDAGQGFLSFVDGLKKSGDDASLILEELGLSDVRLQRAFLSLANAGSTLSDAISMGNQSWEENNALQIEADKRFQSSSSQIQIQKNRWAAWGSQVGMIYNMIWIPLFRGFTTFFTSILPTLSNNIGLFFENMAQGGFNVAKNIGKAFGNIPGAITAGINLGIGAFEGFINKILGGVSATINIIKKIPGAKDILGSVNVGNISLGRIEGPKVDWTPINQGMKKFESIKGNIDSSISSSSSKVKENIKSDIEAEASALEELKNTLGKKKEGANSLKDKLKKQAQDARDVEIDAVNKSVLTQEEKYKKIADISKKYNDRIKEIEGKTNEDIIKEAEDYEKDKEKLMDEAKKSADDYIDKLDDISNKFEDLKKDALKAIGAINLELGKLDTDQQASMSERYGEVQSSIWKIKGQEKLTADDYNELNKLEREKEFLIGKTTEKQREQGIQESMLTESEKNYNKYTKERNELLEKQNILKAFSSNKDAFTENLKVNTDEAGNTTGSYIDSAGKTVAITGAENIAYAQQLVDNQNKLQQEYKATVDAEAEKLKLYQKTSEDIVKVWQGETAAFQKELDARKLSMDAWVVSAQGYLATQAQVGALSGMATAVVNNSNTNSNNKTTTIKNVINNASDASMAVFVNRLTGAGK